MTNDAPAGVPYLSQGQLWRLKRRYVQIVALENLCVSFKLMDAPDQTEGRTLTSEPDTLWRYLVSRHAKLSDPQAGTS